MVDQLSTKGGYIVMSQKSKWRISQSHLQPLPQRFQEIGALILNEFCQVCGYNRKGQTAVLEAMKEI